MAAFGGPERAEIGWDEVRAVWAAGPRNGRPTPWDAWAEGNERVPLSRKQDGVRVPDFDVVESIMEPYNLLEDLLTSCDCHNNGEQPKKVGDTCGDGTVLRVDGWEYYGGQCRFQYRCSTEDKCGCYSLAEALAARNYTASSLANAAHSACSAQIRGLVEKPGWQDCVRGARLAWNEEEKGCVVEVDCFVDQDVSGSPCNTKGTAFIRLELDYLETACPDTISDWEIVREPCDDLAVDLSKMGPMDEAIERSENCEIRVAATPIDTPGLRQTFHTFVTVRDEAGRYLEIHGGPDHAAHPAPCQGFGELEVRASQPRVPTWALRSVHIASGATACGLTQCLTQEAVRINAANICYDPLGPNSNSVTRSILSNCGLVATYPWGIWAPGFGMLI